jgi:hypothetical protein
MLADDGVSKDNNVADLKPSDLHKLRTSGVLPHAD